MRASVDLTAALFSVIFVGASIIFYRPRAPTNDRESSGGGKVPRINSVRAGVLLFHARCTFPSSTAQISFYSWRTTIFSSFASLTATRKKFTAVERETGMSSPGVMGERFNNSCPVARY